MTGPRLLAAAVAVAVLAALILRARKGRCAREAPDDPPQDRLFGRLGESYTKDPCPLFQPEWHADDDERECPECDAELLFATRLTGTEDAARTSTSAAGRSRRRAGGSH